MKKTAIFIFMSILLIGCSQSVQVSFDDDKSRAIRAHYENYLNNDMDGLRTLWSPEVKVYLNSKDAIGAGELVSLLQAQHAGFDPITMSFGEEGGEDLGVWVQTINYPGVGEYPPATMTQSWFDWSATGKISGKKIVIPAHIGFKWGEDGKIIEEWHNYDTQEMMAELSLSKD